MRFKILSHFLLNELYIPAISPTPQFPSLPFLILLLFLKKLSLQSAMRKVPFLPLSSQECLILTFWVVLLA